METFLTPTVYTCVQVHAGELWYTSPHLVCSFHAAGNPVPRFSPSDCNRGHMLSLPSVHDRM